MSLLGDQIRLARQAYGMSQSELARRVGISKTSMNLIERGEVHDPRWSHVVAIAKALRLSLDTLVAACEVAHA
jgi:transcriptional regulator with XRE-family HTH domain